MARDSRLFLLVLVVPFLLWNAVYDHVLIVAEDLYIVLADVVARHGAVALVDDWMTPARALAFASAWAIAAAALLALSGAAVYLRTSSKNRVA